MDIVSYPSISDVKAVTNTQYRRILKEFGRRPIKYIERSCFSAPHFFPPANGIANWPQSLPSQKRSSYLFALGCGSRKNLLRNTVRDIQVVDWTGSEMLTDFPQIITGISDDKKSAYASEFWLILNDGSCQVLNHPHSPPYQVVVNQYPKWGDNTTSQGISLLESLRATAINLSPTTQIMLIVKAEFFLEQEKTNKAKTALRLIIYRQPHLGDWFNQE